MLNFIICEDNTNTIEKVYNLINKIMINYNFNYKIHKFTKYDLKMKEIINTKCEQKIYILDVELPVVSGLEIASSIRENDWDSVIVFLTAHNECRDDVFYSRLLAFDYIPKNKLSLDRLKETINLIINKYSETKVFNFKFDGISYRIPYSSILYIEKVQSGKKCSIITENKETYYISDTINHLKEILGKEFYQSHKSILVNTTKIKEINSQENEVIFTNGICERIISNRCRKGLKEYVKNS